MFPVEVFLSSRWSNVKIFSWDLCSEKKIKKNKTAVPNLSGSTDLRTAVGILDRDPSTVALTLMFRISTPPPIHYKINERANHSPPCEFLSLEPCIMRGVCVYSSREDGLCILLQTLRQTCERCYIDLCQFRPLHSSRNTLCPLGWNTFSGTS